MTERPETSRGSHPERAFSGALFSSSRLEAFSDGVFAIAITLLVLDLAIGAAGRRHLLRALVDLWPSYLAYVTSFFMIGLVWIGHHVIISISTGVDRRLTKINLVLLFVVAFLPFPTRLLGEFIRDPHAERVAAVFYGELSNVVDSAVKNDQAATFWSVIPSSWLSSSVTLMPSVNFTPSRTSATRWWPLKRRQRSWAVASSL